MGFVHFSRFFFFVEWFFVLFCFIVVFYFLWGDLVMKKFVFFVFCVFLTFSSFSFGAIREFRIGVLDHDPHRVWGSWCCRGREEGIDYNAELIFDKVLFSLFSHSAYPSVGVSLNDSGDTSKIYGGFLWNIQTDMGFFFDYSFGLAAHNGRKDTKDKERKALGSEVLFRNAFESGWLFGGKHRVSVMVDHVSNADLAEPNQGLDSVGLRYGFVF